MPPFNRAEHDALLADVLACPGDDTPRMLFADWCSDNHMHDRAEFIWLQLALNQGPRNYKTEEECPLTLRHHWREDYKAMRAREAKLWPKKDDPLGSFESYVGIDEVAAWELRWDYERGFVGYASGQLDGLIRHREMFFRFPVTGIRASDKTPWIVNAADDRWSWFCLRRFGPSHRPTAHVGETGFGTDMIPEWLFDLLEEGVSWGPNNCAKAYPSPAAAQESLSCAFVRWGRRLAGLSESW